MVVAIILLILIILYLLFVIFESRYYEKQRKKIKCIIHVNGIRGKSTVTRLIASGISNCGMKVFCKTTGTIPTIIDTFGNEKKIKRFAPANILEQLKVLRLASKENCDVLVIECMAVNPNYQYISEHKMLKSNIGVITNVRLDHLDVMGETKEEIAYSLANTVPYNGDLVIGSNDYYDIFNEVAKKVNCRVHVSNSTKGEYLDEFDTFKENIDISLKVCEIMNLPLSKFYDGLKKYYHDPGCLNTLKKEKTIFINGFSINDPDSIKIVYDKILKDYDAKQITILLNERSDRPFRVCQHIEMIKTLDCKDLILMGSNISYIKHELKDFNISIKCVKSLDELLTNDIIFGIGNIKGMGMKVIDYFTDQGDNK